MQVNEFGRVAGVSGAQQLSLGGFELGSCDLMTDIQNQLHELSLTDSDSSQTSRFRIAKKPPSTYLCHLCFQKGHFIKDCPQVTPLLCDTHNKMSSLYTFFLLIIFCFSFVSLHILF